MNKEEALASALSQMKALGLFDKTRPEMTRTSTFRNNNDISKECSGTITKGLCPYPKPSVYIKVDCKGRRA